MHHDVVTEFHHSMIMVDSERLFRYAVFTFYIYISHLLYAPGTTSETAFRPSTLKHEIHTDEIHLNRGSKVCPIQFWSGIVQLF